MYTMVRSNYFPLAGVCAYAQHQCYAARFTTSL